MRRVVAFLLFSILGCRPDPGVPDYSGMEELMADRANNGPLPGPSPYVPGTKRLIFGIFYEGDSSTQIKVDDASRHYYIFIVEGTTRLTYSQRASSDRVEGIQSDEFIGAGEGWWGGGIIWDNATDLSEWKTLHVSLASSDAGFEKINLTMLHGDSQTQAAVLKATDYGWKNDGVWHHLSVPLADFVAKGANLKKVRGPFVIGGMRIEVDESLLVDNLYAD